MGKHENTKLSERNQLENTVYYMISFIYIVQNR